MADRDRDQRLRRVAALYDEVIERVIESLRASATANQEELDEHVLDDLRTVRRRSSRRAAAENVARKLMKKLSAFDVTAIACCLPCAQRWNEKVQASGALAAGVVASSGLVSTVGGGQSMMPAQYAAPVKDSVAASAAVRQAPRTSAPLPRRGVELSNLSAGVPRGADLYTVVHDGTPDSRIDPPVEGDVMHLLR